MQTQYGGDLEVIDHDLLSVEQALQRRASGGAILDGVKIALVVAMLPLILPLRIATLFASGLWHRFPMFRWPWRSLEPVAHDVERTKSSIAAVVARMKGQGSGRLEEAYALLDELDAEARPSHTRVAGWAAQVRAIRAGLQATATDPGLSPVHLRSLAPANLGNRLHGQSR